MYFGIKQRVASYILLVILAMLPCGVCASSDKSVVDQAPEQIAPVKAPFPMPQFKRHVFPDRTFNIKDFGAVEGGKVKNSDPIRKAIEAANKAGGGKVLIPAGKWLTGAIHLKSNVNLHLDEDALVLFSNELKDYLPAVFSRHEGMECLKPSGLIYALGCDNIAITGKGRLHGREFLFACEMVRNGRLGTLKSVYLYIGGPPRDCYLPAEPVPKGVNWDMWLGPAPWRPFNSSICMTGIWGWVGICDSAEKPPIWPYYPSLALSRTQVFRAIRRVLQRNLCLRCAPYCPAQAGTYPPVS